MRLIDADALPKLIIIYQPSDEVKEIINVFTRVIAEAPTIDAEPTRHGVWIENDNGTYSCSKCKSWIPKEQHYYARYCLHCGARMEGVDE